MNPSPVHGNKNGKNGYNRFSMKVIERTTSLSYPTLFLIWAGMAVLFAMLYFILSSIGDGSHGPEFLHTLDPIHRFYNALYYSIITATSTGYGDITPQGASKALASMQSMAALFVFAVFVTKLVSHNQEEALRQVHKLTFEDVFHNIREGLFIVRQDVDHIVAKLNKEEALDDEDWRNLVIAYKHAQSLIQEIPDFYDGNNELYTIDIRREQLMQEAVHRTLNRINTLLDTMSQHGIDWSTHPESIVELQGLVHVVDVTTPLWKESSPYDDVEAFEDIIHLKEVVHRRITEALPA